MWRALQIAAASALFAFANGAKAKADVIYGWQGNCALRCRGNATAVLTLTDGASPLSFDVSNFISFQFSLSQEHFF
jgi:hypothetical protein